MDNPTVKKKKKVVGKIKKNKKDGSLEKIKYTKKTKKKINIDKKEEPKKLLPNNKEIIDAYISSMDEKDKIAMMIATDHLETSFNIERCIGFKKFKNSYLSS